MIGEGGNLDVAETLMPITPSRAPPVRDRFPYLGQALLRTLLPIVLVVSLRAQNPPPPAPLLQPGDMVRLKIWREPDLSGDYAVDESGQVVFPKIGPLAVTRLSADSLKSLLITTYATYLRNPSVEVTLLRRVNVLGAVRTPGLYQVDPTMTLVDVLAMAGGRTPDGQKDRVDLLRQGEPEPIHLRVEARVGDVPVHSGDQLIVPERSWMSRNSAALVVALLTSIAIVSTAVIYH